MDNKIESKWNFLFQCRPDVKGMTGNSELTGGHISYSSNHEKILHFIRRKARSRIMRRVMNLEANYRPVRVP